MLRVGTRLSNIQKELLKLYSTDVSDQQLQEIKLLLGQYFANKATDAMDKFWQENNVSEQDMINWANEHKRSKGSH